MADDLFDVLSGTSQDNFGDLMAEIKYEGVVPNSPQNCGNFYILRF